MRNLSREFYTPKSYAAKVTAKNHAAVVYLVDAPRLSAMGFAGKAQKPTFHYTFKTEARRAAYVAQFFAAVAAAADRRAARAAEKKAFRHTLKVGTLLRTCWGYDQTNVEFFEVVRLVGASMVEVREVAQESEETAYMQGKCVPVPGSYVGPVLRKRVLQGNTLDIHGGFGYASVCETKEVAPGVHVVAAAHWTNYA